MRTSCKENIFLCTRTLATVNYSYPVDEVMTQLNATNYAGGTVEMSWFEMNGKVYNAKK